MRQTILLCDKCKTDQDVFTYGVRVVGGAAPDFQGDLCRDCYMGLAKEANGTRGKPHRGRRAPMIAVDYDTGKPL